MFAGQLNLTEIFCSNAQLMGISVIENWIESPQK